MKPQYFTMTTAIAGAVATYRVDQFTLPIIRPQDGNNQAVIMEILRADYYLGIRDFGDGANTKAAYMTTNPGRTSGDASTFGSIDDDIADPRVFGAITDTIRETTSGSSYWETPHSVDLTDANGNGMLYASDKINLVYADVAGTTAAAVTCKLLYRFVKVGLIEYLGLLTQQQG